MRTLVTVKVATPFGELAIATEDEVVMASGFMPLDMVIERLGEEVRVKPAGPRTQVGARDAALAWASGDLAALDTVQVRQPGGEFRQAAWRAMREVPPGTTITYGRLAAQTGNPRAVRAAGSACSSNLVAPFVPCHRVVSSSGGLGGYLFGLPIKRAILVHEGAVPA
ncbi:MAG: methylated-DNA--[protein]-cysteine S-methyltransferase [Hyphomicrobiaceae bacterium]